MSCANREYYQIVFNTTEADKPVKGIRNIVFQNVARSFYEKGFYGSLPMIGYLVKNGFEISWLNVTRDLLRENWKDATIISNFKEINSFITNQIDIEQIKEFLASDYDTQCRMLFHFHFANEEEAKDLLKCMFGGNNGTT